MPTREEIRQLAGMSEALGAALDSMSSAEHHGELTLGLVDAILQAVVDSQVVLCCRDCGSHQIERVVALAAEPTTE